MAETPEDVNVNYLNTAVTRFVWEVESLEERMFRVTRERPGVFFSQLASVLGVLTMLFGVPVILALTEQTSRLELAFKGLDGAIRVLGGLLLLVALIGILVASIISRRVYWRGSLSSKVPSEMVKELTSRLLETATRARTAKHEG